ncbi:MAG: MFS transporter [Clostridium sp.]|jgi:MFS family permease|uniref:MFS transporter n=1 Tax=Clostridium sp. TaxID=1506 RepID=UPI0025BA0C8F|nr:MFS transporter [Clostridium sp.]MCH3965530.1 MFS transporter [Clostridium sp.]MCI1716859.1 MFS transporter [Clostridium sp.]MCI1801211.1 MFS transporter [Clostridium sp.]MCI1815045.1 MFS transporter [Clostridium sp.]MCI1871946.1 MFS transporter [Clostridium sp.]
MQGKNPFPLRFVAPLYMGSTLNPINSSLLATALVPIALFMHVSAAKTTILVSALYLASSIVQPTSGKLSEEFGPKHIFLTGIFLVLLGGIIGGFGKSLTMLIAARVFIGIGTSTAYPSAMLLIRRRADEAELSEPPGNVLGALQIAGIASSVVGLPIGGVLVGVFGWRSTFFINIPVTFIAFLMAVLCIPKDTPIKAEKNAIKILSRIDCIGIIAFAVTMISLLVFLFSIPKVNLIALGIVIICSISLILWELKVEHPFIDIRMLSKNPALTRTYIRLALLTLCIYTVLYGFTEWLEADHGISSSEAGLLLLPMSILSAIVISPVSRRNLIRGPLILSAVSSITASFGILFLNSDTPIIYIMIITLIFGITMGTMTSSSSIALYTQVTAEQIATASGLLRTFGYIGSIASSALVGIVFHTKVADSGLHLIAVIMIIVSGIALLITISDRTIKKTALY